MMARCCSRERRSAGTATAQAFRRGDGMTRSGHRHTWARGARAETSMSTSPLLKNKLGQRQKWRRILQERLTEPVHLNLLSLFVLLFGSYRAKIAWDLVIRQ